MLLGLQPVNARPFADDIVIYFETLRQSKPADYHKEKAILETYTVEQLTESLLPFYTDSLVSIRQKAYYLTYKKGLQTVNGKTIAVRSLLKGCTDPNGGVIGQTLRYLQEFAPEDFDQACRALIAGKIPNTRMPHYKELAMLAGYIHTGRDALFQVSLEQDLPDRYRWYVSLALARMGDADKTAWCVNRVKKQPVNNDIVSYALPDLIYTRQKEAIDYCVALINSDDKLCYSQNPDISEKMICGYQIMALLAKLIVDIPVSLDESGDIVGTDYQKILQTVRDWFATNANYQIIKK
jgi:hypothetical protein